MAFKTQMNAASLIVCGYIHRIESSKKFKRKRYKNMITTMNDAIINICIQYYFIPEPFPTGEPLRIAVLGYLSVTKPLIFRFVYDKYDPNMEVFFEEEFSKKSVVGCYTVNFALQDLFSDGFTTWKDHVLNSDAIMLAYDVADINTLEHIKKRVYTALKNHQTYLKKYQINKNVNIFMIVGDKSKIKNNSNNNISKMGKKFADEINCEYKEVCSKDGNNVNECFHRCAVIYLEKYCKIPITTELKDNKSKHKSTKKECFIL